MKLQEAIAFVAPVIARKPTLPVLEHLWITGGYLIAYDGLMAMCCPIAFPEKEVKPHAKTMQKAAKVLEGELQVSIQDNGRTLKLSSGKTYISVASTTDEMPAPDFLAQPVLYGARILHILKTLLPFTAEDAWGEQYPWATTILLEGSYAWACNVTSAVRMKLDSPLPEGIKVVIPSMAAKAIVATGDEPEVIMASETRFVSQFSGGRFLSAPTVTTPWPRRDWEATFARQGKAPSEGFYEALRKLQPFIGDTDEVRIAAGAVSIGKTMRESASIWVDVPEVGTVALSDIRLTEAHAKTICFDHRPVVWHGAGIEGIVNNKRSNA